MRISSALAYSAMREFSWIKHAFVLCLVMILILGNLSNFEGIFFPVLKHVQVTDKVIEDNRVCFTISADKVREASGVAWVAQLYRDDDKFPVFTGLEHVDGTAYSVLDRYRRPQHISSRTCVQLHNLVAVHRYGLRVYAWFMPPGHWWYVAQRPIWIDFYRDES